MVKRRTVLAGAAGAAASLALPRGARADEPVDVLLVFAVDVSRSIDEDEARLQRQGYREALTDPRVLAAIRGGMLGAIAVAYVEWAGIEYQRLVIPWTRIETPEDAMRWGETLAEAPRVSLSWTSISGGIRFSRQVLAQAPMEGMRKVIDVSADGVNNSGPPVEMERDAAVAEGIVINGLPIINDRPGFGRGPRIPLDQHFQESVIGGPGAFMIVAQDFHSFGDAVRRKIIREIA